ELQTKLEKDINEGEKDYIVQEIDILYACKKIAMMLQQLNRILHDDNANLDDNLREWIEKTLHEEPWEDYHNFVLYLTPEVLERAYALGDYGHDPQAHVDRIKALKDVNIEEINLKDQSISIIEKNLEAYLKEQKEACIKQDNNLSISNGPRIYARVEAVLSELSDRVSQITEEVGPQEVGPNRVQPTIQAADGVELPVRGSPFSGGYNGGSHNPVAANGYSYGYPQMPPPNYGGYPPQSGPRGASFNGHHSQGGYYGHGQGYALPLYHMVPLPMQLLFVQGGYYDGEHPPNYQQTAPPANQGFIYVDLRTQNIPVHSLPMDPIHNRYVNTQPGYGQQPYNT
ncbi:hypothetical protein MKW94_022409, partial [Papaver nudicaule]|nr:hypothetical protein [Papaver nudicaule]